MRVDLDADVRTRDGEAAGTVQRVVIDPRANEVTDFVISTGGLFGHDVLVPRERLEASTREGQSILLDLTKDELRNMPPYTPADYSAPSTGWIPPAGYAYPLGAFLWPAGYEAFERPAATRPTRGEREGEIWPAIEKGTLVCDRQGDDIGVVDDLKFESTSGRLQGMVLRAGGSIQTFFGGGDTVEVDTSQIDRVAEGVVYLRVRKDEL